MHLEQTHLASLWPRGVAKHGTVLSLSRLRVRVSRMTRVFVCLSTFEPSKVHHWRIPPRHESVSAGEKLRCWKARRQFTCGLSTTCSQQIFYHRHRAANRPGRTASTAWCPWGCMGFLQSSVGENSLYERSTGILILARVSSRLRSGIIMNMHMRNGIQHKGFVEAASHVPWPYPRHRFWQVIVPARSHGLGSRQRDRPPPHLEIFRS